MRSVRNVVWLTLSSVCHPTPDTKLNGIMEQMAQTEQKAGSSETD